MLKSIQLFAGLLFLASFLSCKQTEETDYLNFGFEIIHESKEFIIYQKDDEFILQVIHPFPASANPEAYHLISNSKDFYQIKGITHQFHYPISRISISSTTHLGYLEALGMQDFIDGASNLDLYYSEAFNSRIDEDKVVEIGGTRFKKEILIKLASEPLFAFALGPDDLNVINDLRKSGLKVVLVSEFLESDPLAKAEWLKFFAAFFGEEKLQKSESLLQTIKKQYNDIKDAVANAGKKPSVMVGFPWKGTWYVSGANSFQAKYYEDAAAEYRWSEFNKSGSVPLDIELVLKKGSNADIWLNPGDKKSIDEILTVYPNFSSFKAIKERKVYSNYGHRNNSRANDAWERGVVRPDLILKDLASIFHPEIMGTGDLCFYKRLEK